MGDWTFFSNYGHVLVCLASDPAIRLRDVAREVGITERAVQKIVRDMQDAGYLTVTKQGRCNRYRINRRRSLRHPLESHCNVGKLLTLLIRSAPPASAVKEAAVAEPPPAALEQPPVDLPPEPPPEMTADDSDSPAEPKVEPETQAEAEPEAVRSEETPAEKDRPRPSKTGKKNPDGPLDTRQQGSLF